MKRVVFTVCIDFDDEMELQEGYRGIKTGFRKGS